MKLIMGSAAHLHRFRKRLEKLPYTVSLTATGRDIELMTEGSNVKQEWHCCRQIKWITIDINVKRKKTLVTIKLSWKHIKTGDWVKIKWLGKAKSQKQGWGISGFVATLRSDLTWGRLCFQELSCQKTHWFSQEIEFITLQLSQANMQSIFINSVYASTITKTNPQEVKNKFHEELNFYQVCAKLNVLGFKEVKREQLEVEKSNSNGFQFLWTCTEYVAKRFSSSITLHRRTHSLWILKSNQLHCHYD